MEQLSQQVCEISGVVFGPHLWKWACILRFAGLSGCENRILVGVKNAQKWGKINVFGFPPRHPHIMPKIGLSNQLPKHILGQAIETFVIFGGAIRLLKDGLFENRKKIAETTETQCQNGEAENELGTGGSEIGHLISGSKWGLKNVSFYCTSFALHLQQHKENCLTCLAVSVLENMSLLLFLSLENCCAIIRCVSHGSVQSLYVMVCCVCCFWGASDSDDPSSFPFLIALFLFFFSCCFFFFLSRLTFCGWVLCSYSSSLPFLFLLVPPCHCGHLKRKTTEKYNYLICLPMCFIAKNSFQKSLFAFFCIFFLFLLLFCFCFLLLCLAHFCFYFHLGSCFFYVLLLFMHCWFSFQLVVSLPLVFMWFYHVDLLWVVCAWARMGPTYF